MRASPPTRKMKIPTQQTTITIYDLPVGSMPYSTRDPDTGIIYAHEPIDKKPVGSADSVLTTTKELKKLSPLQMLGLAWIAYRVFLK